MRKIETAYIGGKFVQVSGTEELAILNPTTEAGIGSVRLGNAEDARRAIVAASDAQGVLALSTRAERVDMLRALQAAILTRSDEIRDATIMEYGAPTSRAQWISRYASDCFGTTAAALEQFSFTRRIASATVLLQPMGVAVLISPWNAAAGTICSKLASSIAAGCACVIKPSELGALQAQVVAEAIHAADLAPGCVNILLGRGSDVGDALCTSPDVRRISFTGSTATGKVIARAAADSMKRVTLSLSGKSAAILLEDVDIQAAIPMALQGGFQNNGQACIAGTRILVPRARLSEVNAAVQAAMPAFRIGDPKDPSTVIGPLASAVQRERIQHFIARGIAEGAHLIAGGVGMPDGLDRGFFVRPTVFSDVDNAMDIAREEIFGPVLSIIPYDREVDAIRIANDSPYGLLAYIFSRNGSRAKEVAASIEAGGVLINRIAPELLAPFGGVKQSGIGREFGVYGLESFLEAKSIAGA